jgi:hypothetical protein
MLLAYLAPTILCQKQKKFSSREVLLSGAVASDRSGNDGSGRQRTAVVVPQRHDCSRDPLEARPASLYRFMDFLGLPMQLYV